MSDYKVCGACNTSYTMKEGHSCKPMSLSTPVNKEIKPNLTSEYLEELNHIIMLVEAIRNKEMQRLKVQEDLWS